MKTKSILLTTLLALTAAFTAHAGPIGNGGFVIDKPGKYYLIRNIAARPVAGLADPAGISIQANDVELDLAGYTIVPANGMEGKGSGISLGMNVRRVRIHNGRLQGTAYGIHTENTQTNSIRECLFERLQISNLTKDGIILVGDANTIRGCTVTRVASGWRGIVVGTSLTGTNEITDCTVTSGFGADSGIYSAQTNRLVIRRCLITSCVTGFNVTSGCKLIDNSTFACGTPITGNPILSGVNN